MYNITLTQAYKFKTGFWALVIGICLLIWLLSQKKYRQKQSWKLYVPLIVWIILVYLGPHFIPGRYQKVVAAILTWIPIIAIATYCLGKGKSFEQFCDNIQGVPQMPPVPMMKKMSQQNMSSDYQSEPTMVVDPLTGLMEPQIPFGEVNYGPDGIPLAPDYYGEFGYGGVIEDGTDLYQYPSYVDMGNLNEGDWYSGNDIRSRVEIPPPHMRGDGAHHTAYHPRGHGHH